MATTTPAPWTTRRTGSTGTLLAREAGLHRFVRGLIALRNLRESMRQDHHLTLAELMQRVHGQLHGVRPDAPDTRRASHSLAITAASLSGDLRMHFARNAWWEPLDFELPALPAGALTGRLRIVDTARASPLHRVTMEQAEGAIVSFHRVEARSSGVMFARVGSGRSAMPVERIDSRTGASRGPRPDAAAGERVAHWASTRPGSGRREQPRRNRRC